MAFDQFNRRYNNGIHKPCESSILYSIDKTQLFLLCQLLEKLIGREDNSVDDGYSDEGIVDAAKQLSESLIFYNCFKRAGHGERVIHLHSNLKSIEYVAGDAVSNSREGAAEHVLDKEVEIHRSNCCEPKLCCILFTNV